MKSTAFVVVAFVLGAQAFGQATAEIEPVPVKSGAVALAPANTRIDFVGKHEGPKPDPRKGGFAKFAGKAQLNGDGSLESVGFEIQTASLWTEMRKLTNHLKSPDFFDVRQHPKAMFKSTSVQPGSNPGEYEIVGQFTLLGVSREIEIPAEVSVTDSGMTLVSKFELDRTQFGMTYGQGKITKGVQISVKIGQATPSGS